MATTDGPEKIIIWTVLRSCSTVFSKAISKHENTKILEEPFGYAYYYGEERISRRFEHLKPRANMTYKDIKQSMEMDYNDYSVVFSKDGAYHLRYQLDRLEEVLPDGYKHTFLIRHPRKTVSSLYKCSTLGHVQGWNHFDKDEAEFKTLHDMFFKIKDMTDQTPVVVETADLLENPGGVLKMYCQRTGLVYSDNMLTWEKGVMTDLEDGFPGWQETLRESTGFLKPSPSHHADSIILSEEEEQAIEEGLEYYNILSKYKLSL